MITFLKKIKARLYVIPDLEEEIPEELLLNDIALQYRSECVFRISRQQMLQRRISDQIDRVMAEKQLYLDSRLTLEKLAEEIGTNRTYVSRTFSHHKSVAFTEYINGLRLRHAAGILYPGLSAEDISLVSGFGSSRTFLRALAATDDPDCNLLKKIYLCQN